MIIVVMRSSMVVFVQTLPLVGWFSFRFLFLVDFGREITKF